MTHDPGEPFAPNTEQAHPRPVFRRNGDDTRTWLTAELVTVRGELARMDAKTNALLAVCGLLLGAGITVLVRPGLGVATTAAGGAAAVLVAAALALLLLTVRPYLNGGHGFMRWAAADGGHGVLDELTGVRAEDEVLQRADELHHLAALLRRKYATVRMAATLLLASLGVAATAAVLAVWAR